MQKRHSNSNTLRMIVLGYIVRGPIGGLAWHHLQYLMGLALLGHDVYFLEDSDDYPSCYDPSRNVVETDPSYGLKFASDVFNRTGLGDRWAYYDAHAQRWHGPCADHILDHARSADMVLNLSGVNPLRPWLQEMPTRVLVDTDPVFTQIRHLTDPAVRARAAMHTKYLTFGENFGQQGCSIPDDGFPWQPTRQPVVLSAWPVTPGQKAGKFTTVMQWDSYPPREYDGQEYGMKSASFADYMDLPEQAGGILEIALGSASAPRPMLSKRGWLICDPLEVTKSPWTYQHYIQQSKGEFTVAKHGYVVSRSGWFSERSACYLASGRPVITQQTGFSKWLKTEQGVLSFITKQEALARIEQINSRYESHCKAAREIAEEYFDSGRVLTRLLEQSL